MKPSFKRGERFNSQLNFKMYRCKNVGTPSSFNGADRLFPHPTLPSFWEFKLEEEPDERMEDPVVPPTSDDLVDPPPKSCLFSESPFSRFRQFFLCLLLNPDFTFAAGGVSTSSPKN